MEFFTLVDRAAELVAAHGRVSRRGLEREFGCEAETIAEIIDELVLRGAARSEGDALVAVAAASEPTNHGTHEGELRHLTVVFCDVVGATALSGEMNAEAWSGAMRAFHEEARIAIEEWNGHVGNYMGDGLVAYFGYPVAQEDAAERAIRAGLALLDRLPELNDRLLPVVSRPLEVRVGVHTGPAVVDEFGGVVQAMGETANLAARLEGAAPPGAVVMSPITRRLVSGVFVTADLGQRQLKGIAEPVLVTQALRVGGVAPRLGPGRTGRTPLVGRAVEVRLLEDRWDQAREGWGQVVVITGEAGIGKSRLVDTFRASLADQPHSWLDATCSPYSQSAILAPMAELHRRGLGFTTDAPVESRTGALSRALEAVGLEPGRGLALLSEMHGLRAEDPTVAAMSPEQRRVELFDLLIEWLLALARLQPTVFFFDDLHWCDPTTLELLERLVDQVAAEPLLLIVTARPDRPPAWGAHSSITPMQLSRMTRDQTAQVALGAAGADLNPEVVQSIVARCDGVPLFAEELAVALAGQADGDVSVPATLQDLLMARLERLGALRDVAHMASIIGREFRFDEMTLLSAVDDAELERLLDIGVREELFYRRGVAPDVAYLFKHALMRDAVYESMLSSTQRRHHQHFADALITARPLLAAERPDLIAEHLTAGEDPTQASTWWERAAQTAAASAAASESEQFFERAIETTDPLDSSRLVSLKLHLAGAMNAGRGYGHPDIGPVWAEIIDLARDSDLDHSRALAHTGRALQLAVSGDFAAAKAELKMVSDVAANATSTDLLFGADAICALMATYEGRPLEVIDRVRASLSAGHATSPRLDRTAGIEATPALLGYQAYSEFLVGRFATSARTIEAAHAATSEPVNPSSQANITILRIGYHEVRREREEASLLGGELEQIGRRYGLRFFATLGALQRAGLDAIIEADVEKLALAWDLLAELSATGSLAAAPTLLHRLGRAELACGQPDRAHSTAGAGLALAEQTTQRFMDPQLVALRLEAGHQLGSLEADWRIEARDALAFAKERSLLVGRLELATTQARILTGEPGITGALDTLNEAIEAIGEPSGAPVVTQAQELLVALREASI